MTQSLIQKLGLGCSGAWGMKWFPEKEAVKLIHLALEHGICEFDTGNFYCGGEAEKRLGLALKELPSNIRQTLLVSSKTGTQQLGARKFAKDFTPTTIRKDVETSLSRLHLEHLDTLYLHGPSLDEIHQALPTLSELQKQGLIQHIGICADDSSLATALEFNEFHCFMGSFNLFKQEHVETFKAAKAKEKKTIAIAPLAQGLYRRKQFFPTSLADAWYLTRALVKNRKLLTHAQKQSWLHEQADWPATQIALRYVLEQDFIDLAVFNTTRATSLVENAKTTERALPAVIQDRITQYQSEA